MGSVAEKLAEIRRLYFQATPGTIQLDLGRAIEILKSLPTEDDRERARVYMDGLSQMRSEWKARPRHGGPPTGRRRPAGNKKT